MAEEEVVLPAASPNPSDHKRKLEDLEPTGPLPIKLPEQGKDAADSDNGVAESDSVEVKRPRVDDDKPDGLAGENGLQEKSEEQVTGEKDGEAIEINEVNEVNGKSENGEHPSEEAEAEMKVEQLEGTEEKLEQSSADNHEKDGDELVKVEDSNADIAQEPVKHENTQPSEEDAKQKIDDGSTISRKIEVPSARVGALIGKAGDTIWFLQNNSGAKIQIFRDGNVDRDAPTKMVEIVGTLNNVVKAENLINAILDEDNAGVSPSLVVKGLATAQAAAAIESIEIPVPNDKVGLIIGRKGETIKGLQARSGARIQMIPQPEGEQPKERAVKVTGDKKQIEIARELINGVMNQAVRISSNASGFNQQNYRSRGSMGPSQWGSHGHHTHSMPYGYQQQGPHPSQNTHYKPPTYRGGYPQQMAPRDNFSSNWNQRPHNMQGTPQQGGGFTYYSGQGASAPPSHGPGPISTPSMGPPPSQSSYNYGQPHGLDYAHPPFPQAATQHGYNNHGGHATSQPGYTQQGHQPGPVPQQQYGKPASYGVPSQGPYQQTYAPPTQQGQAAAQYGSNVPAQQQYPQQQYPSYASGGSVQPTYPSYGSAPPSDGYTQAPTTTAASYAQQGTQPVPSYGQPAGQQAAPGYAQVGAGGYGQYPSSQQGYTEQTAANTNYGYQAPQDPTYGAGPTYGAAPPSAQPGYSQPATDQPVYDQNAPQTAAPGVAPVPYGKTVTPQTVYPHYDSTQMYAAPR